jgi:hypothetical protein
VFSVGVVALAVPLVLIRQVGASPLDTLWAEDGAQFYTQALWSSPLPALTMQFGGYLHVYPRLIAEVAAALPPDWVAEVFALGSAATVVALAAVVFMATAGHIRSLTLRATLVVAMVLAPVAGGEMLNNVANLQWYLLFAAFWVLLWRPPDTTGFAAGLAVCVLAPLSAPLSVGLIPAAVLRLVAVRSWRDRVFPVAFLAAFAIQLARMVTLPSQAHAGGTPDQYVAVLSQRVLVPALAGLKVASGVWVRLGWVGPALVGAVFVAGVVWGAVRRDFPRRWTFLLALLTMLTTFTPAAMARDGLMGLLWKPGEAHVAGGRYTFVPILLALSAAALLLDRRPRWAGSALWEGVQFSFVVVVVLTAGMSFFAHNSRSPGPSWSAGIRTARLSCATADVEAVSVTISPVEEGWTATIPCFRLVSHATQPDAEDPEPAYRIGVGGKSGEAAMRSSSTSARVRAASSSSNRTAAPSSGTDATAWSSAPPPKP